jgi:hypothetical protein
MEHKMFNFYDASSNDLMSYAQSFYKRHIQNEQHESLEHLSNTLVKALYDEFRSADNERLFGLVRVFRFGTFADLPAELQAMIQSQDQYWLALLATMGIEPAWCDRRRSRGHQVIPADDYATPMLRAAFQQIGLKIGGELQEGKIQIVKDKDLRLTGYFFVPTAIGSPYVPDQAFVKRYGIQSVIGLGAPTLNNSALILLAFARSRFTEKDAEKFGEMSPFLMSALSAYNLPGHLWG